LGMSRRTVIKKTVATSLGKIDLACGHVLCRSRCGFGVSPYLQELACYLGQEEVFDNASELLQKVAGIELCDKQIERICHRYGQLLGEQEDAALASCEPVPEIVKGARYYGMLDGGMVFTRESGWKEMKLARIFPASDSMDSSQKRGWIRTSTYIAHLGDHKGFLPKVERYTDEVTDLVMICDGAAWIWKWVSECYPSCTQILDFYHAKEHLWAFARLRFPDHAGQAAWAETQSALLLEDGVEAVIGNIEGLEKTRSTATEKARADLLNYYKGNLARMKYKSFTEQGLMIGSGPIEAAHRHVVQKRMKRSGQRWTTKGAQQVVNLRVAMASNKWHKIMNLIKMAA
jgi:hypothetical protein